MKNKLTALLISIGIMALGFTGLYWINNNGASVGDIEGVQTQEDSEKLTDGKFEHKSARVPDVEQTELLFSLGQEAGLSVTNVIDTSFKWEHEEDSLLVRGQGIIVDSSSEEAFSNVTRYLEGTGYIQDEQNTSSDADQEKVGYKLQDRACLLKQIETDEVQESSETGIETFITKLEIKCGEIDYERFTEDSDKNSTE